MATTSYFPVDILPQELLKRSKIRRYLSSIILPCDKEKDLVSTLHERIESVQKDNINIPFNGSRHIATACIEYFFREIMTEPVTQTFAFSEVLRDIALHAVKQLLYYEFLQRAYTNALKSKVSDVMNYLIDVTNDDQSKGVTLQDVMILFLPSLKTLLVQKITEGFFTTIIETHINNMTDDNINAFYRNLTYFSFVNKFEFEVGMSIPHTSGLNNQNVTTTYIDLYNFKADPGNSVIKNIYAICVNISICNSVAIDRIEGVGIGTGREAIPPEDAIASQLIRINPLIIPLNLEKARIWFNNHTKSSASLSMSKTVNFASTADPPTIRMTAGGSTKKRQNRKRGKTQRKK
jgi:hypothetical protein